jgi:hypothetical protein
MGRNKAAFNASKPSHPLALSAKDIVKKYNLSEVGGTTEWQRQNPNHVKSFLDKKYENASRAGSNKESLVQSITTKGYNNGEPLHIRHLKNGVSTLINGHHRLAVMLKHSPDTPIPLQHFVDEH